LISYNTVVNGYAKNLNSEEAYQLFHESVGESRGTWKLEMGMVEEIKERTGDRLDRIYLEFFFFFFFLEYVAGCWPWISLKRS
jgi:pentatricopeptide repeat protein